MLAAGAKVVCVCSWHIKIKFVSAHTKTRINLFDEAEEEIGNVWFVLPLKGLITLDWFHAILYDEFAPLFSHVIVSHTEVYTTH